MSTSTEFLAPPRRFLRECRRTGSSRKVSDSTGAELSGTDLLRKAVALGRVIAREVPVSDSGTVGVYLPPTVAATVVNAALALRKLVAVNLNYTLNDELLNYCLADAGVECTLTSRKFLEKRPADLKGRVICLEDFKPLVSIGDKLAAVAASMLPVSLVEGQLGLTSIAADDLLTVIYTSGSTGRPKGVMLTHGNIAAQVDSLPRAVHLKDDDTTVGILPFFHAFGFTTTLWWPLTLPTRAVHHVNPLDAKTVGQIAEKYAATILITTPTFLRAYLKRCTPQQFGKLEIVIAGAEKLDGKLREDFRAKFGVEPVEGYGATELSPFVSCNIPEERRTDTSRPGTKHGTIGRPLPGQTIRVVDPDSGEQLAGGAEGMLQVSGPNIMKGYLNLPEKTAEVRDGDWYVTGDLGFVDADGFVHITGRLTRFSKIGGEMVPHQKIEEELLRACGDTDDEDAGVLLAVTAVPDPKKGERIVVLHRPLPRPVEQVVSSLSDAGLPNLWIPDRDAFAEVDEIPVLGSGKLDLASVRAAAAERFARTAATPSVSESGST
ncbi:MAG: AMP-binding protein [Planctomycetota bacterium]